MEEIGGAEMTHPDKATPLSEAMEFIRTSKQQASLYQTLKWIEEIKALEKELKVRDLALDMVTNDSAVTRNFINEARKQLEDEK